MADAKTTKSMEKPTADSIAQKDVPETSESQTTVAVSRLVTLDGAIMTGYRSHELAGAFAGVDSDEEVTISEAKRRVKEWLKSPAEPSTQD